MGTRKEVECSVALVLYVAPSLVIFSKNMCHTQRTDYNYMAKNSLRTFKDVSTNPRELGALPFAISPRLPLDLIPFPNNILVDRMATEGAISQKMQSMSEGWRAFERLGIAW